MSEGSPSSWSAHQVGAAIFFVAFLLIQIAVPLWKLSEPRPARFGWQMYSTFREPIVFLAEHADGSLDTLRLRDHFRRERPEIDHQRFLPAALCRSLPAATAIVALGDDRSERHSCR